LKDTNGRRRKSTRYKVQGTRSKIQDTRYKIQDTNNEEEEGLIGIIGTTQNRTNKKKIL